jgi:putative transposase
MEPMPKPRKQFSPVLKATIAIEAIKGKRPRPRSENVFDSSQPGLYLEATGPLLPGLFAGFRPRTGSGEDPEKDELYRKIGQLKVHLDWLKKNLDCPIEEPRKWIEPNHPQMSIARQCRLADLSRLTYYQAPIFESE